MGCQFISPSFSFMSLLRFLGRTKLYVNGISKKTGIQWVWNLWPLFLIYNVLPLEPVLQILLNVGSLIFYLTDSKMRILLMTSSRPHLPYPRFFMSTSSTPASRVSTTGSCSQRRRSGKCSGASQSWRPSAKASTGVTSPISSGAPSQWSQQ